MMNFDLSEQRCNIILAFADNNMNVSNTAKQLFMHRNTVVYHLERIKEFTDKNPFNFYDLHDLVVWVKEHR